MGCATPAGITCPIAKRSLRTSVTYSSGCTSESRDRSRGLNSPLTLSSHSHAILSPFSHKYLISGEGFLSKYLWIEKPSGTPTIVTETQSSVFESMRFLMTVTWRRTRSSTERSRRNALHRLGDPSGTAFATAPHQASRGLDAPASVRHPDARRRSASTWNAKSPPCERAKGLIPGGRRRHRLKSTAMPRRLAAVVRRRAGEQAGTQGC